MRSKHESAPFTLSSLIFCCRQLFIQKVQLNGSDLAAGDDSLRAALAGIGVKPDEFDEGSIECEVDTRLVHGCPRSSLTVGSIHGTIGTEVSECQPVARASAGNLDRPGETPFARTKTSGKDVTCSSERTPNCLRHNLDRFERQVK